MKVIGDLCTFAAGIKLAFWKDTSYAMGVLEVLPFSSHAPSEGMKAGWRMHVCMCVCVYAHDLVPKSPSPWPWDHSGAAQYNHANIRMRTSLSCNIIWVIVTKSIH